MHALPIGRTARLVAPRAHLVDSLRNRVENEFLDSTPLKALP